MPPNIIVEKSFDFAIRIVNAYKVLKEERREWVMSKQLLKSGTSIGANIKEAIRGQSKPDFNAKMHIAMKEASETEYWLELLQRTKFLSEEESKSLLNDCHEILRILVAITKSCRD